jgi:predicted metal-dependent enzyme (double-stranded beta helix superfamily)
MKRFVLGLGLGFLVGLASVALMLAVLLRIPDSVAGSTAEPILLLENDRVRAWSLTLEPGQSTAVHTHQLDEIVICLESGKIRITKPGPEPEGETVQPKFGAVFMPKVKGVTHVLTNSGESRYRQISIELK